MPLERETIIERERPNETVIVGGTNPAGVIGAVVAAVLVVLFVLWLANGGISGGNDGTVNVDLPNVTVTP